MKRLVALLAAPLTLIAPQLVYAQESDLDLCPETQFNILCKIETGDFGGILGTAIVIMFIVAIIIALLWLILGGIKWITSGGDSSKVEGARNQIIAAVIGLVVVFLSYFILNFVLTLFGIPGVGGLKIPTIKPIVEGSSAGGSVNDGIDTIRDRVENQR